LRVGDEPATLSPERGAELLQGRRDAIANGEVGKRPAKKATKKRAAPKAGTTRTVKKGATRKAAKKTVPKPGDTTI
jgi:DNA topoisomerase-1